MFDKLKQLLGQGVDKILPGDQSSLHRPQQIRQAQPQARPFYPPAQGAAPYSGTDIEQDLAYRTANKFVPPSPFATGSTVNPEVRANSFMGRAEDDQYVITPTGSKPLHAVNPGEQWEGLPGPAQFKPPAPYKEDPLEQFKRFLSF